MLAAGCAGVAPESKARALANARSPDQARAQGALDRLTFSTAIRPSVRVIPGDCPAAYCWLDGTIVLTRGLVTRLTDDQLAGSIAHEIGHLSLANVQGRAQVRFGFSGDGPSNAEWAADDIGCDILEASKIQPQSLAQALTLVRDAPQTSATLKPALTQRIERLSIRR